MIKIGQKIDERYRVTALLGEGGMAEVYEAFDVISKRQIAVKILREVLVSDQVNVERFQKEARASAYLNHPNIVCVYNLGTHKNRPYMVNELIKGPTLAEALSARRQFTYLEAIDVMIQLAKAVSYSHQNGVIHRDIKPSNIFLLADGTVKLGDFGIAKMDNTEGCTAIFGSSYYLAPELAQGKTASPQSDIYAMGITFFELITGRVPYDGASNEIVAMKHIKEHFPSPRKYLPNVPREIEKIIFKACKKRPQNRYRNVNEFANELIAIKENPSLLEPHVSFLVRFFGFATEEES